MFTFELLVLGGERIISPLKSSMKSSCISSFVARFAKFCLPNKSLIIFD